MHDVENSLTALSTGRWFAADSGARSSLRRRWRRRATSSGSLPAAVARAKGRERPRGVFAHKRFGVVERAGEHPHVVRCADVADYHGALRFNPRSFARFIGEPLNAILKYSSDIANRSRASVRAFLSAIAARGQNASSPSGSADFSSHGHTSWHVYRLTHLEIPLATGLRTVRKSTRSPIRE